MDQPTLPARPVSFVFNQKIDEPRYLDEAEVAEVNRRGCAVFVATFSVLQNRSRNQRDRGDFSPAVNYMPLIEVSSRSVVSVVARIWTLCFASTPIAGMQVAGSCVELTRTTIGGVACKAI